MKIKNYDFSGWATRNNIKCSDGRTIMKNAFIENDGKVVPLVWNHMHNDPLNILGHAMLENKEDGVYAYCKLNETEAGKSAKILVDNGDIQALSIFANNLTHDTNRNVLHGAIREVSLVLAGANPGAYIDNVISHGEKVDSEAVIYTGEELNLEHGEIKVKENEKVKVEVEDTKKEKKKNENESEETVKDVLDTLTEKQQDVVYALLAEALDVSEDEDDEENKDDEEGEDKKMKHNIFDNEENNEEVLSHSELNAVFNDVKRYGSLRDTVLAHGITNIEYLFPEAKTLTDAPGFISRKMGWVTNVMNSVHHTPFSRIKSIFANITEEDARAKGYIKGKKKKDEVFSLLKRSTTPTTIYKKQKLDRDDVVDITDFDVVAWIKTEMRTMLDEEIARAILVGDGRLSSSDDKVNEQNIRPIWTDDELYTIKAQIEAEESAKSEEKAKAFIRACIKSRKDYKGTGEPTLYITDEVLTDCLLLEDTTGRIIYDSVEKLATALRVSSIVSVPVMEGLKRKDSSQNEFNLMGIIVNLNDYNVGADKGGAVNMFDDFDIDYNAQKYLIETRCSGAMVVPYGAIAIEHLSKKGSLMA